jgi:hypothetical protein
MLRDPYGMLREGGGAVQGIKTSEFSKNSEVCFSP